MSKFSSSIREHSRAILAVLLFCSILLFVRYKMIDNDKRGIITVAKATRFEGAESGSDLYIDIFLEGKVYQTSVDQECQYNCIGNYFFVKVLKDNPTSYVIFYGDKQVPDCIIENVSYFKGWKDIPTCKNY